MPALDEQEPDAPVAVVRRPGESVWQMKARHGGASDEEIGYDPMPYQRRGRYSTGGARSPLANAARLSLDQQKEQFKEALDWNKLNFDQKKQAFEERKQASAEAIHEQAMAEGIRKHAEAAELNKALAAIDYRDPNFHEKVNAAFNANGYGADDPRVVSQINRLQGIRASFEARADEMQKRVQVAEEQSGVSMFYHPMLDSNGMVMKDAAGNTVNDFSKPDFAAHGKAAFDARHAAAKAAAGDLPVSAVNETEKGFNTEYRDPKQTGQAHEDRTQARTDRLNELYAKAIADEKEQQAFADSVKGDKKAEPAAKAKLAGATAFKEQLEKHHPELKEDATPKSETSHTPKTKADLANEISSQNPTWTREQVITEVNKRAP